MYAGGQGGRYLSERRRLHVAPNGTEKLAPLGQLPIASAWFVHFGLLGCRVAYRWQAKIPHMIPAHGSFSRYWTCGCFDRGGPERSFVRKHCSEPDLSTWRSVFQDEGMGSLYSLGEQLSTTDRQNGGHHTYTGYDREGGAMRV